MSGVVAPVRRVGAGSGLVGPGVNGDGVEDGRAVDAVAPEGLAQPVDLVRVPEQMLREGPAQRTLKLAELTWCQSYKKLRSVIYEFL